MFNVTLKNLSLVKKYRNYFYFLLLTYPTEALGGGGMEVARL